jgi:hypothetical protein
MIVTGEAAYTIVLAQFMRFYGLEYQLIPCGEDCFIDAVVFVGGFWPLFALFMASEGFLCTAPCRLLTFPE